MSRWLSVVAIGGARLFLHATGPRDVALRDGQRDIVHVSVAARALRINLEQVMLPGVAKTKDRLDSLLNG